MNPRSALWRFGHLYYRLRKGPHGDIVVFAVGLAGLMLFVLALGLVAPALRSLTVTMALGAVLAVQALEMFLLNRLRAKANDTHYAISVEHGITREGFTVSEFFMDGAAGNPSLQLYSLKILMFCKPISILELGSGQTTKLLSAYAQATRNTHVLTLEQNANWFERMKPLVAHDYRHVMLTDQNFTCRGTELRLHTSWYEEIPEVVTKRWEYILVDGPDDGRRGTEFSEYARAGLLKYTPNILADRFVVLIDDADLYKHQMMIHAFRDILRACHVKHISFTVHGIKDQVIVCSPEWSFLAST